jgi:hypothetical protein
MLHDMGKDASDAIAAVQFAQSIVQVDMLRGIQAPDEARTIRGIVPPPHFDSIPTEKSDGRLYQCLLLRYPIGHVTAALSARSRREYHHIDFILCLLMPYRGAAC